SSWLRPWAWSGRPLPDAGGRRAETLAVEEGRMERMFRLARTDARRAGIVRTPTRAEPERGPIGCGARSSRSLEKQGSRVRAPAHEALVRPGKRPREGANLVDRHHGSGDQDTGRPPPGRAGIRLEDSRSLRSAMADLTSVLEQAGVEYELLSHPHTERAVDEAEALGLPPRGVAKTLVLTTNGGHVRVVLPASERI